MNKLGFKDIIQKLSFIKEYSSLFLPIVIIVVAALVFIPTQLISNTLRKQVAGESVSVGRRVGGLIANSIPRDQWKEEEKYQQSFAEDANQISLLAKHSSQRELLSYKLFPEPKDVSSLIFDEFGQSFREAIEKSIERLNAHDCPSVAELAKALQNAQSANREGIGADMVKGVDDTIKNTLCENRARESSLYANSFDLDGYDFWGKYKYTGMNEALRDCWFWQVGYWIIEDVVDTIGVTNEGAKTVLASSVKRLLYVNFTQWGDKSTRQGRTAKLPRYVLSASDGFTESCTGRFCNSDFDVVHFRVSVVLSTKAILPFMQQLCSAKQHKFKGFSGKEPEQTFKHNQITILESNIGAIDLASQTHNLYRYGQDAVVKMDLICEYIFDRKGHDEIKPKAVKDLLPAAATTGGTGS